MKLLRKGLTVLIIIALSLILSNLLVMAASCTDPPAPTIQPYIPKPSVPQFTLSYVDHSYDVPAKTTSSQDPYTGEVKTSTIPGYRVTNFTIDVTIRNQAYPAIVNGNSSYMRYEVQSKGHYQEGWTGGYSVVADKNSEYTIFPVPASSFTVGGEVDFRVAASLGYDYRYYFGFFPYTGFAHESSDYSSTKTIIVGTSPPTSAPTMSTMTITPAPNETTIPTQSGNNWNLPQLDLNLIGFTLLGGVIVVLVVYLVLLHKRIRVLELKQNGT
jgi:hypothetical protein